MQFTFFFKTSTNPDDQSTTTPIPPPGGGSQGNQSPNIQGGGGPTTPPAPGPGGTSTTTPSSSTCSCSSSGNSSSSTPAPAGIKRLTVMLDPGEAEARQKAVKAAQAEYDANFGSLDLKKAYQSMFEILWYSQLPCFDVKNITSQEKDQVSTIKRCIWKGQNVPCSSIFKTRPTDRGKYSLL